MQSGTKLSQGKIIKGVGGFYYVLDSCGNIHECKAAGRFRKDGIIPLPGDNVRFAAQENSYGFIEEIEKRRNEMHRPRVANIDMAAIIVSAEKPNIDYLLCDKLLISIKKAEIEPLMIINKCDVAQEKRAESIQNEYSNACKTIRVSAVNKEGLDYLKQQLAGKCTCFAGQSAAGKSSILNALFSSLDLKTGGMSKKTDRGKHTTRHAELLLLDDFSGTVVDTPGFSLFDTADILPEQLYQYYDDIVPYADECKFSSCLHEKEPQCKVIEAVNQGKINKNRYQRYLQILKEVKEKRKKRYD